MIDDLATVQRACLQNLDRSSNFANSDTFQTCEAIFRMLNISTESLKVHHELLSILSSNESIEHLVF